MLSAAAEIARRINVIRGEDTVKESTARFWFQRFRGGNFNLRNKPCRRSETLVDNEESCKRIHRKPCQS